MPLLSLALRAVALAVLFSLAVIDVRARRLPTRSVLALGLLFFADALVVHRSASDVLSHVALAGVVFAVCAVLFALGWMGGGDAKLAAAIFLWAGLPLSWPALVLISVSGTVVALVSLATQRLDPQHRARAVRALAMFSGTRGVPYGVALAAGGTAVIGLPAWFSLVAVR